MMANAIGWALIRSLWQGAAAALVLTLVLALKRSPRVRYAVACLSLLALAGAFAITIIVYWPVRESRLSMTHARLTGSTLSIARNLNSNSNSTDFVPWLAPVWMIGVALAQLRFVAGWLVALRLRRSGLRGVPDSWLRNLRRLRAKAMVKTPVRLVESYLAETPVLIGYLRPMILLPAGLLSGLPVGQMEAILLHELAHVRRHDYLVNLLQTAVESLMFYHPAVWWISKIIREEREKCCDDLVIAQQGDALTYSQALIAIEAARPQRFAIAASGGDLPGRIRRILGGGSGESRSPLVPVLAFTVLMACGLGAWPIAKPLVKIGTLFATDLGHFERDVTYIITDEERAAYRRLNTGAERARFIGEFWLRRDPTPGTAENEYQEEHYRRLAYVNEHFAIDGMEGWRTDLGRVYIKDGPPDGIVPYGALPHHQQWMYGASEDRADMGVDFIDTTGSGEFRETGRTYPLLGIALDGRISVAIPIEFDAPEYFISIKLNTLFGQRKWDAIVRPCNPDEFSRPKIRMITRGWKPSSGCLSGHVYRTNLGQLPSATGQAMLAAEVSDRAGSRRETYTHDFEITAAGGH